MASEQKELGILFVDISDSSHLFKAYGNEGARDIMRMCLEIMREVVQSREGRVVEEIGDELLTVFPSPDSTTGGAVDLQKAIAEARDGSLPPFMAVRIGFHFGLVMDDGDSVFGDTIYTASRVAALAKGNQILTTGETVGRLTPDLRERAAFVEERTLKGTHRVHDIYRISWDDPALTATPEDGRDAPEPDVPAEKAPSYSALELTLEEQNVTLSATNPVCLIGRSKRCDLLVLAADASRVHTRVEYRGGHFVVVDVSSNGTAVRMDDGRQLFLREEELRLCGSGRILISEHSSTGIGFKCLPASAGCQDPATSG